jgi:hypothetical protein
MNTRNYILAIISQTTLLSLKEGAVYGTKLTLVAIPGNNDKTREKVQGVRTYAPSRYFYPNRLYS